MAEHIIVATDSRATLQQFKQQLEPTFSLPSEDFTLTHEFFEGSTKTDLDKLHMQLSFVIYCAHRSRLK